jgi:hypothetical protein
LALAVLLFYKEIGRAERYADATRAAYVRLEAESRRVLALQEETERLEQALATLEARRPFEVYAALSDLAAVFDGEATIRSIAIRDDRFEITAVGGNILGLMQRFDAHGGFGNVELGQVIPEGRTRRERFSLSGRIRAER